jgi:hypothetical protein
VHHIELPHPLPLTCDEEDEDNFNVLSCSKTISIEVLNRICPIPHTHSYNIHSYESRKLVDFLFMSCHAKMLDSAKSFACRIHNLHVEIIEQI